MARLNIELPDEVVFQFRKIVLNKKGNLRGEIAPAVEEALRDWIGKNK